MKLKKVTLKQSKKWLSAQQRAGIKDIIKQCFANVEAEEYVQHYFESEGPFERKIQLFYSEKKLVGYNLLTFTEISKKIILKASSALYPDYRHGNNIFGFCFAKGVQSLLSQPWKRQYYADTMLTPVIYRAFAKNLGIIWPNAHYPSPQNLFEEFNKDGFIDGVFSLRCLVPVDRNSNYNSEELASIHASTKKEMQFYCQINPDFNEGTALFVILPISGKQVIKTFFQMINNKLA